jgi:GR25 family glycosyltransferase involved in LPS biosynthesis
MKKYFDNIYCINLDSRKDRWQTCLDEFNKVGLTNQVERFSGIKLSPGISGCTKSHYELIKLAKSRGEKTILVLEDDFQFVNTEVWNLFELARTQLKNKNLEYDLFYFGGTTTKGYSTKVDHNVFRLNHVKTTHCYVIRDTVFDKIINKYNDVDWTSETNWLGGHVNRLNIDYFYIKEIQSMNRCYGIYPGVCQQRLSHSDILNVESGECLWTLKTHYNNILNEDS